MNEPVNANTRLLCKKSFLVLRCYTKSFGYFFWRVLGVLGENGSRKIRSLAQRSSRGIYNQQQQAA